MGHSIHARAPRALLGLTALAAALCGLFALGALGVTFAARAGFPLDLEWMEGGTLLHAYRLARGQGIYVEPSLDFIPFLYTPLYPALLSVLARLMPLGYLLGRVVSIAAFTGALAVIVAMAVKQAPSGGAYGDRLRALAVGIAGAGAVAAGYGFTGTFYDLVRADSLALCLQTLALACAYLGRGLRSALAAGVFIALGFFTKQTASILGVALGLGLLFSSWRRGLVYGVVAAAVLGAGIGYLQHSSSGWFWTYVFELHQSHAFRRELAFRHAPLAIAQHTWPLWLALGAAVDGLRRLGRLQRADVMLILCAVAGVASAMIGFGTQWAFDNAYIPAVFFPALALAALAARLVVGAGVLSRRLPIGLAVFATVLLGLQAGKSALPDARLTPDAADRAAAERFLDTMRALPGEGFIPFHPYYAVLAGKRPFVHRMGVMDVAAKLGRPRGLDAAIEEQRFSWIILDWKSRPREWPALDERYHVVRVFSDGVDAVRMFSGAETSPRFLLVPTILSPPLPPGARRLEPFDSGTWGDFSVEGDAFGVAPVPAQDFGHGAFVADSGRQGQDKTGVLRSPPIKLDGDVLRFLVAGDARPGLRVGLLVGGELRREHSPRGHAELVEWKLGDLRGQEAVLVVEDSSSDGSLRIDEIVLLPAAQPRQGRRIAD